MIQRLKQTPFGKALHRLKKTTLLGLPLKLFSELVKAVTSWAQSLKPANRKHNATQQAVLAKFEKAHK